MPKSVPLSVRISDKDAAFLAQLDVPEAKTPSDKLRAILIDARRRHEGVRDFDSCVGMVEDMMRPSANKLRAAQRQNQARSDFLMRLYERLPELVAELTAGVPNPGDTPEEDKHALKQFESVVATQVFSMIEEILDLGLTSQSRSFDPDLIRNRLNPVLEITNLIEVARTRAQEEKQ